MSVSEFLKDQGLARHPGVSDLELMWALAKASAFFAAFVLSYLLTVLDVACVGPFRYRLLSIVLLTASIASMGSVWIHIATYLERQFYSLGGKWDVWITHTDWFTNVFAAVVQTPSQWFFSSQLLHFSLVLSLFLFVESKRCGIRRPFSNMVVAACGGVAAGFAIFLVGLINAPKSRRRDEYVVNKKAIVLSWIAIGSFVTIVIPHLSEENFGNGVWLLHAAMGIPVLMAQLIPSEAYDVTEHQRVTTAAPGRSPTVDGPGFTVIRGMRCDWLVASYAAAAGFNLAAWFHNLLAVVATVPPHRVLASLLDALKANECQQAVSVDMVACSLLFTTYLLFATSESSRAVRLLVLLAMPVFGIGVVFPLFLAHRETKIIPPVNVKHHLERRSSQSSDGTTPFGSRRGSGQPIAPRQSVGKFSENFVSPFSAFPPESEKKLQ